MRRVLNLDYMVEQSKKLAGQCPIEKHHKYYYIKSGEDYRISEVVKLARPYHLIEHIQINNPKGDTLKQMYTELKLLQEQFKIGFVKGEKVINCTITHTIARTKRPYKAVYNLDPYNIDTYYMMEHVAFLLEAFKQEQSPSVWVEERRTK